MNAPRLFSIPETAERLGCSVRHVYELISDGRLRSVDIGRNQPKSRVREDDLAAWIEKNTSKHPAARRTA